LIDKLKSSRVSRIYSAATGC